jgi:hypothetical protein
MKNLVAFLDKKILSVCVLIAMVGSVPGAVRAEENPAVEVAEGRETAQEGHGEGEEHEESEFHRNHLAIFLGATEEEESPEGTIGFDYERRLTKTWGWGGFADWAGGDIRAYVLGASLFIHPVGDLKVIAGLGIDKNNLRDETDPLFRLGFLYDFEIGQYTLAPEFNIDFVDNKEVLVYGVAFGRGW